MELFYQLLLTCTVLLILPAWSTASNKCSSRGLKYVHGDALTDSPNCQGLDGEPYPYTTMAKYHTAQLRQQLRNGRTLFSSDHQRPEVTRRELLAAHAFNREGRTEEYFSMLRTRRKRQAESESESVPATSDNSTSPADATPADATPESTATCGGDTPARLCKSSFNTTAPLYGVSLTSGKPVTVVQIFPDLLQQVVYETCDSKECDLIHGECVQTYIPYLFLVIPLGPVTLTGQDYVLVESGCSCRPKYAKPGTDPNPTSIIPNF